MKQQQQQQSDHLPITQKLIKLTTNLCFSTFILFIISLTIFSLTYQPHDPLLSSSLALSHSLTNTIPNSTFIPDLSLLPTGEDQLQPQQQQQTQPILAPQINSTAPAAPCSANSIINCTDPRAITSITLFNSRQFGSSITFLSYETPVPGSVPGECDVAWRFRNVHEKSWRRYRDYRRFWLALTDDCAYEVVSAGKFRSGVNAKPILKPSSTNDTVPVTGFDPEINDTIPVLEEREFAKGRYLYYTRGGDYCKGMNQFVWSFLCGLGEARYLNRTFVIDLGVCLSRAYNNPSGKDEEGKDFRFYFDFEHLREVASVVEESEFLKDWKRAERGSRKKGRGKKISVNKVPTYKITPMELKNDESTIIWRQFDGQEPENYWYRVCEGGAANYVERPWDALWKSKRLTNIVSQIAGKMNWDYDAVHVVRGEKAVNKELWPNLDADTSTDALVAKLTKLIMPMRNLYIATNEPFYNYFDKLRAHFKIHLLDDYKDMWGNNSEWYNETLALNNGQPVEFDGYMRVAVDTEVLNRAKIRVETFNNLTMDCKDGINTC